MSWLRGSDSHTLDEKALNKTETAPMETTLFELWMNLWKYIYFAIECLKSKNKEEIKMSTCLKCQMVSHLNQA